MASQLAYCYSANRLGAHPFPLLITSFTGRIRQAYENRADWKSWKGVEWWEEPLEELYTGVPDHREEGPSDSSATATTSAPEQTPAPLPPPPPMVSLGALSGQPRSRAAPSTIVYLTGDSPNILHALEPNHTYILGGIVDRNRYKRLCLDKADRLGIRHAQLPIGEALPELKTRKVLTVNQVVEILVRWVDGGEKEGKEGWEGALRSVMPSRKFEAEGKKKRREARARNGAAAGGGGGDDDEDDEEEDGEGEGSEQDTGSVYIARDDDDDNEDGNEGGGGEDDSATREGGEEGSVTAAAPAEKKEEEEANSPNNPDATGQM